MANGENINNFLEFKQHIEDMGDRELTEYTAEQLYHLSCKVDKHITPKRVSITSGGISGAIAAAAIGIIEYFIRR